MAQAWGAPAAFSIGAALAAAVLAFVAWHLRSARMPVIGSSTSAEPMRPARETAREAA
jgi:uncharacterized membrane protein